MSNGVPVNKKAEKNQTIIRVFAKLVLIAISFSELLVSNIFLCNYRNKLHMVSWELHFWCKVASISQ